MTPQEQLEDDIKTLEKALKLLSPGDMLDEVLDDPARNTKQNLELRIKNLGKLSDDEIKKLSERAEKKKEEIQMKIEDTTKKKYWVT